MLRSEFTERNWPRLLNDIAKGAVIPVIGPELLTVECEGRRMNLYRCVAERLAALWELDVDVSDTNSLSDVVYEYLQPTTGGLLADVYFDTWTVLEGIKCSIPKPLEQLANIGAFRLFVSTTFDDLMLRALNAARFGGARNALELSFKKSSKSCDDLPPAFDAGAPAVYHVFGRANNVCPYVVTEEDLLDFGRLWQKEDARPGRLCSFLRDKYLMVLGCSFQNWLSRFFLCALKGEQLYDLEQRKRCGLLADECTRHDEELTLFLSRCHGQVYSAGGAVDFINELSERWLAYSSQHEELGQLPKAAGSDSVLADFVKGSIFISYAHEDRSAAISIKQQLEQAGLDAWLDKRELRGGDDYERIIFDNIEQCSIFMPVISQNAASRPKGYFRLEWDCAIEDAKQRLPHIPFICPVVIDDTKPGISIRKEISKCNWEPLEGGRLSEDFIRHCRNTIRQLRRSEEAIR